MIFTGTTLLTSSDIAGRIKKAESDCFIGDYQTALKFEAIDPSRIGDFVKHKVLVMTADHEATEESREVEKRLIDQHGWVPLQELTEANKHKGIFGTPLRKISTVLPQRVSKKII